MRFALRIPGDTSNAFAAREFQVTPASGAVLPQGKQKLQLDFISYTLGKYDLAMMVDVESVGPELLALPIVGECIVPSIEADEPSVDFGEAFLGHAYETAVTIRNTSWLPARFEIVPQDEASQTIGFFDVTPQTGEIAGNGVIELSCHFTCQRLGPMSLPMMVRICGTAEPALVVELQAVAVGPNVTLTTDKVDWGKANVLQHTIKTLTLTNASLIPATYNAITRKQPPNTSFSIPVPTATLAPGEVRELEISVYLDDCVKVTEDLILQVEDAPERTIHLAAVGVGSTISCTVGDGSTGEEIDLATLNFGDHYSNRLCQMEITLENKGRKAQTLSWLNASVGVKKAKKPGDTGPADNGPSTVFEITPDKVFMEPRAACTFTVRGLSRTAGERTETLQCSSIVQGAKAGKVILEPKVTANFIEPLIEPSMPEMRFLYMYDEKVPIP